MKNNDWNLILAYESNGDLLHAIPMLDRLLIDYPTERNAVIHLGFDLWYVALEGFRLGLTYDNIEDFTGRFWRLFERTNAIFSDDPDYCWTFGLGMNLMNAVPDMFRGEGERLLERACGLDPFWARMRDGTISQSDIQARFINLGIFSLYYAADESGGGQSGRKSQGQSMEENGEEKGSGVLDE